MSPTPTATSVRHTPPDPAWRRRVLRAALRTSFKWPSVLPLPVSWLRRGMEWQTKLFPVRPGVRVLRTRLGGVPCEQLRPGVGRIRLHILHFHGGAFFTGSCATHRALAADLAWRADAMVHLLEHRLAPEHPYPAPQQDGLAAWRALLAKGVSPQQIVFSGDSAGCTQVLSLAQHLRDRGEPLPGAMLMISPFLDLRLQAPSLRQQRWRDPMVTRQALQRGGDAHRAGRPADDPRISPLLAPLHGLPPCLVQVGSDEILLDDARRYAAQAQAAGSAVTLQEFPGYWHNFQMFAPLLRAADQAMDALGEFARQAAGTSTDARSASRGTGGPPSSSHPGGPQHAPHADTNTHRAA